MTIDLTWASTPMAVAIGSAWLGVITHVLIKNVDTMGTYASLKRYCKRHFTTILLSGLLAFGIGIQSVAGYNVEIHTIYNLAAAAWVKAFVGDTFIEVWRKREEKK